MLLIDSMKLSVRGSLSPSCRGMVGRGRESVHRREVLLDHVAVGLEPVAIFDQLAILGGQDLHPAAALVVLTRDLHVWYQPAQRESLDGFHAVPDVLGAWLGAALGLDGIARGLDMDRGNHNAA